MCGWQVKLCDPVVTHGQCMTSFVTILCDSQLGLSLLSCVTACTHDSLLVEQFLLTGIKAASSSSYYYMSSSSVVCKWPNKDCGCEGNSGSRREQDRLLT